MIEKPSYWDEVSAMPDAIIRVQIPIWLSGKSTNSFTLYNSDIGDSGIVIEHGFSNGNDIVGNVATKRLSFTIKNYAANESLFGADSKVGSNCAHLYLRIYLYSKIGYNDNGVIRHSTGLVSITSMMYVVEKSINGDDLSIVAYDRFYFSGVTEYYKNRTTPVSESLMITSSTVNFSTIKVDTFRNLIAEKGVAIDGISLPAKYVQDSRLTESDVASIFMKCSGINIAVDVTSSYNYTPRAIDGINYRSGTIDKNWFISKTALGEIATASSLKIGSRYIIRNVAFNVGDYKPHYGTALYGQMLSVNLPKELVGLDGFLYTFANNIKCWFYSPTIQEASAAGVVMTPLFELGDYLSIEMGNGYYCNMRPTRYRVVINGFFYGEVSQGVDSNQLYTPDYPAVNSLVSVNTQNFGTPSFKFLGSRTFEIEAIWTNHASIPESCVAYISPTFNTGSFTVDYVDIYGNEHSLSLSGSIAQNWFTLESIRNTDYSETYYFHRCFYQTLKLFSGLQHVRFAGKTAAILAAV